MIVKAHEQSDINLMNFIDIGSGLKSDKNEIDEVRKS